MRDSINGTWLFGLVVVFIMIFTSWLAISVNYSKAFQIMNGITSIIETHEGHQNQLARDSIEIYLNGQGYRVNGRCVPSRHGETFTTSNNATYCVRVLETPALGPDMAAPLPSSYYLVTVFFRLDLPIMGHIFTFAVSGETKQVYFGT